MNKPLGGKAYGHIPHLPGSRIGPGDHRCHPGQARICTEKPRDKHDVIIVQEKIDGSCVSVALLNDEILALTRAGYPAISSKYRMHYLFDKWVKKNEERFCTILFEGERVIGEWLVHAHGTRYNLQHEPFVAFDIMTGTERMVHEDFFKRVARAGIIAPLTLFKGYGASSPIERVKTVIQRSGHGAIDPVEGAVWRVERKGKVDFLAKWVRPDKVDGLYLENEQEVRNEWPGKRVCPACEGHGKMFYDGNVDIEIRECSTCFGMGIQV